MIKRLVILILLLITGILNSALGQDVHFSQFYASPLMSNPAFTGMFYGTYRLCSQFRSQWNTVTVPYITSDLSVDFRITPARSRYSKIIYGIGFQLYSDHAGDGNYTTNYGGLCFAVNKSLDGYGKKYLGGGLMLAQGGSRVNFSSLQFDDNGQIYIPPGASGSFGFFDISGGALYTMIPNRYTSGYIGLSAYHINSPVISFTNNTSSVLYPKFVLTAGSDGYISTLWQAYPRIELTQQGKQREILIGTFFKYQLLRTKKEDFSIYFGEWYRFNDAMINVVRFDSKNISVGISYDANVSKLLPASGGQGAVEFSFIYIGKIKKIFRPRFYCPRF